MVSVAALDSTSRLPCHMLPFELRILQSSLVTNTRTGSPLLGLDPPLTREAAVQESLANPPPKDRYSDRREYIKSADLGILYRAMGTAAQRMPRLQIMGLSLLNYRTGEESDESLEFSRDKSARIAHLRINTQWGYRPGMEVISAWSLEGAVAEEFYNTMDVVLPWYVEAQ